MGTTNRFDIGIHFHINFSMHPHPNMMIMLFVKDLLHTWSYDI